MDDYGKIERRKNFLNTSKTDIDQLCTLIKETTFDFQSFTLTSIPSYEIKTFRSSRLKRLHTSKTNHNQKIHFSISSSLLKKFRSLSTYNSSKIRCYSSPRITLFRTKSILPSVNEEDRNSLSSTESQLSCTIVDTRRTNANSCNVEELAAYLDNFLYLPKSLSCAAELMYT